MKVQSAGLTIAIALGLVSSASCSSTPSNPTPTGGSPGNGGVPASGGTASNTGGTTGNGGVSSTGGIVGAGGSTSSTGGAGGSCSSVPACGGDVVGTWNVSSSCLRVGGVLDVSTVGLDPNACKDVKLSGSLSVTGTWTAKADTTYVDGTTTTGTTQIELPAGCLNISGTTTTCTDIAGPLQGAGFSAMTCQNAASGGGCTCTGTVQHQGGIALLTADAQKMGNYATAGNTLTADGTAKYSYCVAGNTMNWTPAGASWTATGSVAFQKAGTTGTGGATGSGGSTATGGTNAGGTASGGTAAGGSSSGGTATTGGAGGKGGAGGGGGVLTTGGSVGTGGAGTGTRSDGPCDVYAAANTPCVAAYSMIRALTKTYTGPLYQVRNGSSAMNTGSGGMTKDIGMTADGFADTASQDTFCSGSICTVSLLYDQSGKKNNLKVAPKGLSNGGAYAAMDDFESSATKGQLMVSGHKVYPLYMAAREGYRLTAKGAGMPLGNSSQGIYILADGTHYGTACCWDFGNVSTDPTKYGVMNTIFFGTGFWGKGAGSGPWFLGDFEGGVWAGGSGASNVVNMNNPSMKVQFAFGILKTSPGKYAIRVADLKTATDLTTAYDGNSPKTWNNEGGILLGIGGDNSNNSWGTFYEGAITAGLPTNATDLAVMKNVQDAKYGQ